MNDIDQPVAGHQLVPAPQSPTPPIRRDPDRHLKFGDLLRGLRACCEAFAEPPRSLAIGIDKQIAELVGDQFEPWLIAKLCRWWTSRLDYLRAVAAGGERINLDGSDAGEVTASQRAYAEQRIAGRPRSKPGRVQAA